MLQRFKQSLARFMYGRYGPDELNTALLIFGAVLAVAGMLCSLPLLTVYAFVMFSAVIKMVIGLFMLRSDFWARKIV